MANDELDFSSIQFNAGPDVKDAPPKNTPKRGRGMTGSGNSRGPGRPSKDSTEREISQELAGILKLSALGLMARDMHEIWENDQIIGYTSCIGVYVEVDNKGKFTLTPEGSEFCDAAAAIVVDTPFLMKIIKSGDKFGSYFRLFMALQPLVLTVINNHLHTRKAQSNAVGESQVAGA